MTDQPNTSPQLPDPAELSKSLAGIAERSQRLVADFVAKQTASGEIPSADPLNVGGAFMEMTAKMMTNPAQVVGASLSLWQDYVSLWQNTASRMIGHEPDSVAAPARDDRRFKDEAWNDNGVFDFIKQSYLLTAKWMQTTVNDVEGLDENTAKKVDFYTRQFVDALSPSNFVMTNPQVLRETLDSGGENLVRGLENLLGDLERGDGQLKISMTDSEAFTIGENIATTKGKVVYRNDLMELIQFDPSTDEVQKTPLMIVPAWINKYYILDLREKNSLVKWAVDQGHTVFMISWVNPDEKLAEKTFDDYMLEGLLAAIDAIQEATGAEKVNAAGYCIGGTLLACSLAYMAAKGDDRVNSATYFTTMIDFEEAGELSVFVDESQIDKLDKVMEKRGGYLEGGEMASTFNMMRANDLIWSFVVNNYLLGKDPFPFDLLYWNSDSTRIPRAMHTYYLRTMYLENKLRDPGGMVANGVPLDLGQIKVPTYIVATREDHIAPWKSTFAATKLYGGPIRFVLSGSGHIAGVVNPPAAQKYGYWTNSRKAATPEKWLDGAKDHIGSWWPDWDDWIKKRGSKAKVLARIPGDGGLKVLGDAPGEYVLKTLD